MKKALKTIAMILAVCLMTMHLSCSIIDTRRRMPSKDTIERKLNDNYEQYEMITDYLLNLQFDDWYIDIDWIEKHNVEGALVGPRKYIELPEEIQQAANMLFSIGCKSISKHKENNSISFEMWRSYQSIDCGVLFSIDNSISAEVDYMTECIELEKENWYYYVSDYNKHRANSR